jgi:hypothetical protein
MAKTWFPHEDGLEEGEKSEPILGPRYSPFWYFGTLVGIGFAVMVLYMSCNFIFSHNAQ